MGPGIAYIPFPCTRSHPIRLDVTSQTLPQSLAGPQGQSPPMHAAAASSQAWRQSPEAPAELLSDAPGKALPRDLFSSGRVVIRFSLKKALCL